LTFFVSFTFSQTNPLPRKRLHDIENKDRDSLGRLKRHQLIRRVFPFLFIFYFIFFFIFFIFLFFYFFLFFLFFIFYFLFLKKFFVDGKLFSISTTTDPVDKRQAAVCHPYSVYVGEVEKIKGLTSGRVRGLSLFTIISFPFKPLRPFPSATPIFDEKEKRKKKKEKKKKKNEKRKKKKKSSENINSHFSGFMRLVSTWAYAESFLGVYECFRLRQSFLLLFWSHIVWFSFFTQCLFVVVAALLP